MGMSVGAAGKKGGRRKRGVPRYGAMAEINMTPFIDVVLVLLIIFMVAAPLLASGVPIDLPKTTAGELKIDSKPLSVAVDEKGDIVDGDQLMAVITQSWMEAGRLAKGGLVTTIMSNLGLERYIEGLGLGLVRTAVGDRYVLEHMREHGFNVGGEQSGHIILSDYSTTGDGLVAALQVLAVVKRHGKPVSEVCHRFEPLPQVLKNVRFADKRTLAQDGVIRVIEGGRERLGGGGRLVIRPSGTEPLVRVMGEGDDRSLVEQVVDEVCAALSAHSSALAAE